jgi:hypothetical protein
VTDAPKLTPSVYRFYAGMMATGFAAGILWTMTLLQAKWITHDHAMMSLWFVVGFLFAFQAVSLWRDLRRLKTFQAEIDKMYSNLEERGMIPSDDKPIR